MQMQESVGDIILYKIHLTSCFLPEPHLTYWSLVELYISSDASMDIPETFNRRYLVIHFNVSLGYRQWSLCRILFM